MATSTNINILGLSLTSPLIIAGPCSAETEEQVLSTAKQIASLKKASIFRAGIWKPRTRPGSFEGVGSAGLEWLKKVKAETGLLTAVEVANVKHVSEALKSGVDVLWIGARTTVNPFSMQEIADSLQGVNIPVMVKNPINADLDLWIGALERLQKAGIAHLAAVHRGFSSYGKSQYRNKPMWEIPIELKRRMPDIPMICDPSHICGKTELLLNVSQTAMDLDYQGLMIETHFNPASALSDAKQQVTPAELGQLLKEIVIRTSSTKDKKFLSTLEDLRDKIDEIDNNLITILANRMEMARAIGACKKQNGVTILQNSRWNEIVQGRAKQGMEKQLTSGFMIKLFEIIHQESIHHQKQIMQGENIQEKEK
ncbi:MAG: bifunctional 3-deoxy-7-phosphoheptulonate synthase/chorismate mutase type II [Bacteroidetes bacterium]|nr:bifunctional 3-deoxy-7-phosphoheptulonate synthase/chorismate mutase type II [Bacteroidota bacterium]